MSIIEEVTGEVIEAVMMLVTVQVMILQVMVKIITVE